MNYYIQGDAANADKIKAAFEKLGYDTSRHLFNAKSVLYFTLDGEIRATTCNCTPAIIKTHPDYKELELPVEPKFEVGDWITDGWNPPVKVSGFSLSFTYYFSEGNITSQGWNVAEDDYHLWTIADAKDGDVLSTNSIICIFKKLDKDGYYIISPCIYTVKDGLEVIDDEDDSIGSYGFKPATKEDRELLFRKMKEAGYEWDADKKELCKIQPHYDISNFHAGMPVLVRADNNCRWDYSIFSRITGNEDWKFAVCNGVNVAQCIPFEGNEHLLGTTDICDECYINW